MQSYIQYAALLALASIPTTFAAECAAVGRLNTNAAGGFADGGGAVTGTSSITLYKGDKEVGGYDVCDTCNPVCSDLIDIESDLAETFSWGASCQPTNFDECHGAYTGQTHIDGEDPNNDQNFYGVGISSSSECVVKFECED
ncbi:MAG: hypothetical protein M1831_002029 [Alyxoria varia]|nr:MAG: hypothetical protein M1831_002029 [Alyxoria varia]